jgi:hypothetical protein
MSIVNNKEGKCLPNFWICVDTMRISDWLLAFASEERKDRVVFCNGFLTSNNSVDGIFSKTAESMMLQVCSR